MNLSHVVTIGTFRGGLVGGLVGGLEEGKGVQPILGRKNRLANTRSAESCCQKMRLGFSQIYHHLLKLLTSIFDIRQPFSEISSINLKFILLKLMTILRSEKNQKYSKISWPDISANSNFTRPGFPYVSDHFPIFLLENFRNVWKNETILNTNHHFYLHFSNEINEIFKNKHFLLFPKKSNIFENLTT